MSAVPNDIAIMLAHPGKYAVSADPEVTSYLLVEVDDQRRVHQLKHDGCTRDGLLSNDRWHPEVKAYTVDTRKRRTVFIRVAHPNRTLFL